MTDIMDLIPRGSDEVACVNFWFEFYFWFEGYKMLLSFVLGKKVE